jgi:hypothetical protein
MRWRRGEICGLTIGVYDVFDIMGHTPTLVKSLMNFTLEEFDKLASQMVPTIKANIDAHMSFFFHIYFLF